MATVPVKQQLPATTEGGRRTLLENPTVAMTPVMPHPPVAPMNRPIEYSPSTGSKRKRRLPLMPLPQLPTANHVPMATNNVTIPPVWENPTNGLY